MLFNSLDYLAFLILALAGFWGLWRSRSARAAFTFLFLASAAFYMAWNPLYIGLILFSTCLDYAVAVALGNTDEPVRRKALLGISITGNLGLLGVFKYFNFFSRNVSDAIEALTGAQIDPPLLDVLLPVGISFYTFQTLSYTVDVYRRRLPAQRDLLKFATYVFFFPQLVAGPIVRATEFLPQIERKLWLDRDRVGRALFLIATGMTKKVVFADFVSVNLVDRVFDDPGAFTASEVLIGLYAFTLQIYADFSGYTDVARGSALLFGIQLPENFDRPYQAQSVAEFWRRWHMTLSTWVRDYLYFPLGGSRLGDARTYLNLWITLVVIGLWHGASWNFVIYGNLQAAAVVGARAWGRYRERRGWTEPAPRWAQASKIVLTLHFVVLSRILFRAADLTNARDVALRLFSGTTSTAQISNDVWRVLLVGFFLHYAPRTQKAWLRARFVALPFWAQSVVLAIVAVVIASFVTQEAVPYIYFQF